VAGQLASGVVKVVATRNAFAAVTEDGRVVTWGYAPDGGDSSGVAGEVASGVVEVVATDGAFAAVTESGQIVKWGGH